MSAPVLRRQEHIVRGIVYIVAATLLFTAMNTSVKWLSPHLHPVEMSWEDALDKRVVARQGTPERRV